MPKPLLLKDSRVTLEPIAEEDNDVYTFSLEY